MMIPSITIANVRVFDGNGLSGPRTVNIVDGRISEDSVTGETIDGHGGTLLPGLIDSHIHLSRIDNLKQSAHWGVTTMLDMGTGLRSWLKASVGCVASPTSEVRKVLPRLRVVCRRLRWASIFQLLLQVQTMPNGLLQNA